MLRQYICILLAILFPLIATAQTEDADRLLADFDAKPTTETANRFFDLLDKEQLTDEHIHLNTDVHPDTLRQQVWYWAAEFYLANQEYERGTYYGKKALPYCQTGNNRTVEGDCLTCLAISYYRMGDFNTAIGYAKKCNELDQQLGNPDNISASYNLLAAIFVSAHQTDEAENCIMRGLEYSQKADNPQRRAILLGMACEVYNNKGIYKKALPYGQQALEQEQKLQRKDKIAVRQSQIAESLIGLKRYQEAKEMLLLAIPGLEKSNNLHSLGIACNQMGRILLVENNEKEATDYFNRALQIFIDQKDIFNESRSQRGLYEALRKSNPTQAIVHNDRYNQLRDSIFDEESRMMLSRYAAQLDNERLQDENNELQRKQRRDLFTTAAIVAILAIGTWIFGYRRQRRYQQRMTELTDEITRISQQTTESKDTAPKKPDFNDQQFLIDVITTVNDSMQSHQFGVDEIAGRMGMTTSTFRRRLQQATGETPKAYITAIQMQKAVSMLSSGKYSVNDVAQMCGFSNSSSFSRTFKRIYNVAPTQYQPTEDIPA